MDPLQPEIVSCSSLGQGLWRSEDAGATWKPVGEDIQYNMVWSVAVSRAERVGGQAVVYAGTEPSALWRSEDGGGGYRESDNGGDTWETRSAGMRHSYAFGLAANPNDPETLVISASSNFLTAHFPIVKSSTVYRKSGGATWQEIRSGLPRPRGNYIYTLSANEAEPGVFYLGTREGDIYRSGDNGLNWERLAFAWPDGYQPRETHLLVATES